MISCFINFYAILKWEILIILFHRTIECSLSKEWLWDHSKIILLIEGLSPILSKPPFPSSGLKITWFEDFWALSSTRSKPLFRLKFEEGHSLFVHLVLTRYKLGSQISYLHLHHHATRAPADHLLTSSPSSSLLLLLSCSLLPTPFSSPLVLFPFLFSSYSFPWRLTRNDQIQKCLPGWWTSW